MERRIEFERINPPRECGGGLALEDCSTAQSLLEESEPFVPDRVQGSHPEARWNYLMFLSRECGECALKCCVAVEIKERQQTGLIRLVYSEIT